MRSDAHTLTAALLAALLASAPLAHAADAAPTAPAEPTPPVTPTPAPAPPTAAAVPAAETPAASPLPAPAPLAPSPLQSPTPTTAGPIPQASTPPSAAVAVTDTNSRDDGQMGSHQFHSYGQIGYRSTLVSDSSFDLFSSDDVLNQFSVTLGQVLGVQGNVSFALGAGWDYASSEASVRGSGTSLNLHRLMLVPEVRYHVFRRLYGFGRVGAGIALLDAELERGSESNSTTSAVTFTGDASAGVAWEAVGEASGKSAQPRMWLIADAGYVFASNADLMLDLADDAPARAHPTSLGEVNMSGATFRLTAALSY